MLKKILNSIDSPNVMVFEKIEDLLDFLNTNGSSLGANTENNQKINLTKIKQEAKEKSDTREDAVKELILHLREAKAIRVPKKLGKIDFAEVYNNLIAVSKTMKITDELSGRAL